MRLGQQTVSSLERCPRVPFIGRFRCSTQFTFRLDTTTLHRMVFIAHAPVQVTYPRHGLCVVIVDQTLKGIHLAWLCEISTRTCHLQHHTIVALGNQFILERQEACRAGSEEGTIHKYACNNDGVEAHAMTLNQTGNIVEPARSKRLNCSETFSLQFNSLLCL